jgi:hypothetical protein
MASLPMLFCPKTAGLPRRRTAIIIINVRIAVFVFQRKYDASTTN